MPGLLRTGTGAHPFLQLGSREGRLRVALEDRCRSIYADFDAAEFDLYARALKG